MSSLEYQPVPAPGPPAGASAGALGDASGVASGFASGFDERAAARYDRLSSGVAGVRRRGFQIDLERALLLGGSILLPTGLIVILLGWFGAAHTSYDFEQVPYLISGGILGAALSVAGGFLYFGYWLTRLVHEGRRQRVEIVDVLTRLDNRLATLEAVATGTLPAPGPHVGGANGRAVRPTGLVATATGSLVHRADCSLVQGKTGLRPVDAAQSDLRACKVCQPFSDAGAEAFEAGRG